MQNHFLKHSIYLVCISYRCLRKTKSLKQIKGPRLQSKDTNNQLFKNWTIHIKPPTSGIQDLKCIMTARHNLHMTICLLCVCSDWCRYSSDFCKLHTWPIKWVVKKPPWEPPRTAILDVLASPKSMTWSMATSTSLTSYREETKRLGTRSHTHTNEWNGPRIGLYIITLEVENKHSKAPCQLALQK